MEISEINEHIKELDKLVSSGNIKDALFLVQVIYAELYNIYKVSVR
ncbi:hypothetical protein AZ270_gp15 [Acidianus tailed spindle virus]|nr:hypothetical protein AZ270_gp15 [Acidianus tailed spindle virus]AME30038.1 hypothetical protein ATSV_B45 [Acidianus tailed spindle virus]